MSDEPGYGKHAVQKGDLVLIHYTGAQQEGMESPHRTQTRTPFRHPPSPPAHSCPINSQHQERCQMARCLTPHVEASNIGMGGLVCFGQWWCGCRVLLSQASVRGCSKH